MKKITKLFITVFLIFIITGCGNEDKHFEEINIDEYNKLIENKETFILEIMSTKCSACTHYKPTLKKVLDDYDIDIKYINILKGDNEKINNIAGIDGTPTVIFYKNGEEETVASRIVGSISYQKTVNKFISNGIIDE